VTFSLEKITSHATFPRQKGAKSVSDITSLGAEGFALNQAYRLALRKIQAAYALYALNPTAENAHAALAKANLEVEAVLGIKTYFQPSDEPELREALNLDAMTPGQRMYLESLFSEEIA
jgi:hypothetical protein